MGQATVSARPKVVPSAGLVWCTTGCQDRRSVLDRTIRVLLFEDDAQVVTMVSSAASGSECFQITECVGSVREALDSIAAAPPDAILMGSQLGGAKGVETLAQRSPGLPIVVITATDSGASEMLRAGAQDTLTRTSANPALLEKAIQYAMERASFAAAIARQQHELEQFAVRAAHDINAPLRAMSGFSEILAATLAPELSDDHRGYLEQISVGAKRLQRLVSDMLTHVRAGRDEDPRRLELADVARDVVEELSDVIAETGTVVECDPLPRVHGQQTGITTVLRNLLRNAITYRSERAPVIRLEARPLGPRCLVSVRDNGIGMKREDVDRILRPFERLHSHAAYEGSGLGLATVDRVVRRHGGMLRIASKPGRGSVVSFDLPVAP